LSLNLSSRYLEESSYKCTTKPNEETKMQDTSQEYKRPRFLQSFVYYSSKWKKITRRIEEEIE
jgi:hypothetical protein